jgi:hypothetical protein
VFGIAKTAKNHLRNKPTQTVQLTATAGRFEALLVSSIAWFAIASGLGLLAQIVRNTSKVASTE